jgi:glucokinase
MILAGDIGGTNTRLAIVARTDSGRLRIVDESTFRSTQYEGLHLIVREFLGRQEARPEAACFGVAGPVHANRCKTMNLSWIVDAAELSDDSGIPYVAVINDLEANGYGISCLDAQDLDVINDGDPNAAGHGAVVSPGTGLGEAGLFWDGQRYIPIPTEGGHTDYGPRTPLEYELGQYLTPKYDHLSYERIVSGPGLVNIYQFLLDTGRGVQPDWLGAELQAATDKTAVISNAGLNGSCSVCGLVLDIFLELFGAEAGNVALTFMARGGVWLGGGIVVKILPRLKSTPHFMSGFISKGRLRRVMEKIPVRVILNDKTALLGAASYAFSMTLPR